MPPAPDQERQAQEQAFAEQLAEAQQQEEISAGEAAAAERGAQIQQLTARANALKPKTSSRYVPIYMALLVFAGVVDLVGIVSLGTAGSLLSPLYSVVRYIALSMADEVPEPRIAQDRLARTVVGGLVELVPMVNVLPLLTTFMVYELIKKQARVRAASAQYNALMKQAR